MCTDPDFPPDAALQSPPSSPVYSILDMSSNGCQTPDLASVLKTLAGLTSQNQYGQATLPSHQEHQPSAQAPQVTPALLERCAQGTPPTASRPECSDPVYHNTVDPATITEWSAGLRCLMKTVAKHESILQEIRRMIKIQHEHEEQWWNGRKALIERQEARLDGQKKLDDVLKAIGGVVSTSASNIDPNLMTREIEEWDVKVYRAQMKMARENNMKLRSLGVPFFGTKTELVRLWRNDGSDLRCCDSRGDAKEMIDEMALVKLQTKMLTILEDLCGD